MSIDQIRELAHEFEKCPELVEIFREAEAKARKLGIPEYIPQDEQFEGVKRELLTQHHTPDLITRYWQARWNMLGKLVGLTYEVMDCDYYQDEIEGLEHLPEPRRLYYAPDQLETTPEGLILLGRMHPKMDHWTVKAGTSVTYAHNQGGYFHMESSSQTPYLGSTELQLEEKLKDLAKIYPAYIWSGPRLANLIIASQDSDELIGNYFEESSWAYLLGFRSDSEELLHVGFSPTGRLRVPGNFNPKNHPEPTGARFEGYKP